MKKLSGILLVIATICILSCSDEKNCPVCPANNVLHVGVLLDLTGPRSASGLQMKVVLDIAKKDIEDDLKKRGFTSKEIIFNIEDSKSDPQIALEKIKQFKNQGIMPTLISTSAELLAVRDYAVANKMLLLSYESTAASLASKDDNIFRFCITGKKFSKSLIILAKETNKKVIVPIYRNDVWGEDYVANLKADGPSNGVEALDGIKYNTTESDFSTHLARLADIVEQTKQSHHSDEISIVLISFSEADEIIKQAAGNQILKSVKWFGADGIDHSAGFLSDPASLEFVETVNLAIITHGTGEKETLTEFHGKLKSRIGDSEILPPSAFLYDLTRILALTWETTARIDCELFKKALPDIGVYYQGCTDEIGFDENGDRMWGQVDCLKITQGKFKPWAYITFGDWAPNGTFRWY